jgi:hypothetical protein
MVEMQDWSRVDGGQKKKFNIPKKMPINQTSPMTPPHPAWVFSETRAIFFQPSAISEQVSGKTSLVAEVLDNRLMLIAHCLL